MRNRKPQGVALGWYAIAPLELKIAPTNDAYHQKVQPKDAPTGHCIPAKGATLGMTMLKQVRSEGTLHLG